MIRVRRMEEKCAEMYSAGKIRGFLHLYVGEEAVAAGSLRVLGAEDAVIATYREHAHALLRGIPMAKIMAEMFGKQEGCSGGRGGSMHLFDAGRRFYGGNAIVAGGLPTAAGLAFADKQLKPKPVSACYFGEGAIAEGAFHETMNMAELWQLPVLFCCENNGTRWAPPSTGSCPTWTWSSWRESYRVPAASADGMDVLACHAAMQQRRRAHPNRGRPVLPGVPHLPVPAALDVRSGALPRQGRSGEVAKEHDPIQTFTAAVPGRRTAERRRHRGDRSGGGRRGRRCRRLRRGRNPGERSTP